MAKLSSSASTTWSDSSRMCVVWSALKGFKAPAKAITSAVGAALAGG